jgi:hypothetical protein
VAQTDLHTLQPLREIIQGLLQNGLTGMEILRDFFSREVRPRPRREITMRMHPRPSCPDNPFSVELGDMEMNTRIRGVLAPRADPNLGSSPIPLRERVDSS